jgi:exodeoxyribonuclease VII large subunit
MVYFDDAATASPVESAVGVAALTTYLQDLIEQDEQLRRVWVVGEVSSASDRGGHLFFTLKDTVGTEALQCVVWRSQRSRLTSEPIPGEQVVVLGQVRIYPQRSTYQLMGVQILPAGAGLQALRRQQLRDRLQAEGLFDADQKRPLPPYPHTIAVVTSPQAAAWGDIQRTLRQRHPGLRVLLSPAIVQGPQAPAAIAAALDRVGTDGRAEVVILARGGGAREDLDCFDDEQVVRAIVISSVPVITGIGHQRDECLADLAADACAHTPTAAAEQVVPAIADLWQAHHHRRRRTVTGLQSAVQMHYERVADVHRRLETLRLPDRLHQEQQRLAWLKQRWTQRVRYDLQAAQRHCQGLGQTLHSLDPAAVLRRGYALVRQAGQAAAVTRADQLQPGDQLHIQLGQGAIAAQVTAIAHAPPPADPEHPPDSSAPDDSGNP